mmetsp:Transcript_5951/g.10242  ORF Transcript_5951/g.10242 Transcript_5951/m.10242 type:complete len:110 (+) Transcript_5951:547-876(+)
MLWLSFEQMRFVQQHVTRRSILFSYPAMPLCLFYYLVRIQLSLFDNNLIQQYDLREERVWEQTIWEHEQQLCRQNCINFGRLFAIDSDIFVAFLCGMIGRGSSHGRIGR